MNKKTLIIIYVILFLILIFLIFRIPYVYLYNKGNELYEDEDYELAVQSYEKALNVYPPKKKECSIRINLALSMIYQIDFDRINEEDKDNVIKTLEDAKDVLCEKGCATEDNDGHSKKAQKLKNEIDDLIEELQSDEENNQDDDQDDDDEDEDEEEDKEDKNEQELKEQLRDLQKK